MRLIMMAAAVGLLAQPAFAFQETTVGGGQPAAPAAVGPVVPAVPPGTTLEFPSKMEPGKGLQFSVPEVSIGGKGSGTEVRIPGIGTVGVLPKLDFGLELLYGATDLKSVPDGKGDPGDVQIRGTIKHRF